jgi:CPA1 family monovalent cation:H+ antiporter
VPETEIVIGLLVAIAVLAELARPLRVPYPVLLVLAGLALGFVPGLPAPRLDPDTFFFFFLPPLVYSEAMLFPSRELYANRIEISALAVGLVLFTAAAVAAVAHEVVGLPWAPAFVLGAVVGSTDPVAATSVIRRLGVGRRVATILQGEALVNDGTALVVYRLAISAAATGTFSLTHAIPEFCWVAAGGVTTGAVAAWIWERTQRWITEPEVEISFSLVMPFAAYFPAERLGVSGVLAAVTAGLLVSRRLDTMSAAARLKGHAFWGMLTFLLNSTLFLLVGLSFPAVLDRLGDDSAAGLVWDAVAIAATVVGVRLLWMFAAPPVLSILTGGRTWRPAPGELFILGWSGMRGGVSLAAALSIPELVDGRPFPGRDTILFLTYMVLLATLVVPASTLGPLINRLGLGSSDAQAHTDDAAHAHILRAAVEHIEELVREGALPADVAERLVTLYELRLDGIEPGVNGDAAGAAELSARRGMLAAQWAALADLRESDRIGEQAARDVEQRLEHDARAYGVTE